MKGRKEDVALKEYRKLYHVNHKFSSAYDAIKANIQKSSTKMCSTHFRKYLHKAFIIIAVDENRFCTLFIAVCV